MGLRLAEGRLFWKYLTLWAPGTPKVHIQGNLSTGFKGERQGRTPAPLPTRPGTGCLLHWTQFPSDGRADLDGAGQYTEPGEAPGSLQAPLALSSTPVRASHQQAGKKMSVKNVT